MRIVFFGSPAWAVTCLEAVSASQHQLVGVVSAPDKPVKRSRRPAPTPVTVAAARLGIPLIAQPASLRGRAVRAEILAHDPDLLCVVAYGRLLPGGLLDAPRFGALNLHFSLLPRHRGASPVQHAILAGDRTTGVTTMQMDRGLDTGPIYAARDVAISARATAASLSARLSIVGAALLVETIDAIDRGATVLRAQDDAHATLAPPLVPEMGWLDWTETAAEIDRRVRAFASWPAVVARTARGTKVRLVTVVLGTDVPEPAQAPGTILARRGDALQVACHGGTSLELLEVQPEGGRPITGRAALNGRLLALGERLLPGRPER